ERRPLPSACGAEEGPRELRPTGPRRAPPGPASERRPARGRWSRSRTRAGRPGRPLPRRRRMGPHVSARHTRPRDRAGGRDAQGGPVRAGVPRRPHPVLVPTEEIAVSERALPAYPPDHYFNRELSWLEFNARVLEEAADPSNPLPERRRVDALFRASVYPVLTPLAIDPGHPFPHVHNKSLNIALVVERKNGSQPRRHFAVVQVPAVLDRVVVVSTHGEGRVRFILL